MAYKPKRERSRLPAFRNVHFGDNVNVTCSEESVTLHHVLRINGAITIAFEDAADEGIVLLAFEDLGWHHYDLVFEKVGGYYGHYEWCLVPRYKH